MSRAAARREREAIVVREVRDGIVVVVFRGVNGFFVQRSETFLTGRTFFLKKKSNVNGNRERREIRFVKPDVVRLETS